MKIYNINYIIIIISLFLIKFWNFNDYSILDVFYLINIFISIFSLLIIFRNNKYIENLFYSYIFSKFLNDYIFMNNLLYNFKFLNYILLEHTYYLLFINLMVIIFIYFKSSKIKLLKSFVFFALMMQTILIILYNYFFISFIEMKINERNKNYNDNIITLNNNFKNTCDILNLYCVEFNNINFLKVKIENIELNSFIKENTQNIKNKGLYHFLYFESDKNIKNKDLYNILLYKNNNVFKLLIINEKNLEIFFENIFLFSVIFIEILWMLFLTFIYILHKRKFNN